MATEILDIIDTTVKIGLGAIISGVTTYIISNRLYSHELKKQRLEIRKETLKECLHKIDKCSSMLNQAEAAIAVIKNSNKNDAVESFNEQLVILTNGYNEIKEAMSLSWLLNNKKLTGLIFNYTYNVKASNKLFYVNGLNYNAGEINKIIAKGEDIVEKINTKIGEMFDALYA